MNNYDIKCRVIEEELRFIWPEWHVVSRLGGGAFGDVEGLGGFEHVEDWEVVDGTAGATGEAEAGRCFE